MRAIAGGIVSVLALTSAIASAQTVPASDASSTGAPSGEIVVTAQKRSQGINDVPIAISAFTGVKLADSGVKSLKPCQMSPPA